MTESYASPLSPPFTSPISKTIAEAIRQRCKLYLFAAIYSDTPPHVVERVITPFPCSAISPQRLLSPQYDSCSTVDHDDDDYSADDADNSDGVGDILSQSSMYPGPPSPRSGTSLQGLLNFPRDSNTDNSVDGGYDDGDVISSQSSMSPDPPSPKSVATTSQRSSHLVPVTSSHRTMSSDLASQKSDDLSTHGPSCPAPSPYDSTADSCDSNDSDGGGDHTLPQWTMSPSLPSNATSQQAYDPTITAYNDVDYVVSSQPSPTG